MIDTGLAPEAIEQAMRLTRLTGVRFAADSA
jgi:hypothetical protein